MIIGARQGMLTGLHRLAAAVMARDLCAFLIPGPDISRAYGLDIEAAGMRLVASPRHASVLVLIGPISPSLRDAAAIIYAQMLRPRALFALGTNEISPLPHADVTVGLSQQDLIKGVHQLRTAFSRGAFQSEVTDFDAPVLHVRIEYTCSMHPEIAEDEPGSCPKCGMNLIPREVQASIGQAQTDQRAIDNDTATPAIATHELSDHAGMTHAGSIEYSCPMHPEVVQNKPGSCPECGMNLEPREAAVEYTCPMHPEVVQSEPGSCPKCGMNLEPREATVEYTCPMHPEVVQSEPGSCPECGMNLEPREAAVEYTCPMHPEVVQSEPGSCPECGMNLELREVQDTAANEHASMDHSAMSHDEMGFMSMIDITKDLPRSDDSLPMDWLEVPFGPFFPGLPGGLLLTLTLDGDTVAGSSAQTLVGNEVLLPHAPLHPKDFIQRFADIDPLAPLAYQCLACRAIENVAAVKIPAATTLGRVGALERERIASHLGWLALFGQQTGFGWLQRRAASLQLKCQQGDCQQILASRADINRLIRRLHQTPLLKSRTIGIGRLTPDAALRGPVARAVEINNDARSTDPIYLSLGFKTITRKTGDTLARLQIRLDEISHSLALIEATGSIEPPALVNIDELAMRKISGTGEAEIETPRGLARLQLTVENGRVTDAQLETPSTYHLSLINALTEQQELGDALVAIGSLDLSPWEIRP